MSAVLLGVEEPNTEPWYELRRGGIGASEVAGVLGLSRYMSPYWLWHFKKGLLPAQRVNTAMEWGHRLEPLVRSWWAEQHPEFIVEGTPGTYSHAERSWQRCNPDGLIYQTEGAEPVALYEGKTARYDDGWGKAGTADVPLDYACQIQHSLDIFGLPVAYVAVLFGGSDPREYVVEANPEDQATIRNKAAAFWESIQADDVPPLDASDHTYEAVRQLHPNINKELLVDLTAEQWGEYLSAKAAVAENEAALTLAKSRILDLMGSARIARFAGTDVLRRQASSSNTPYLREVS